MKSFWNFISTLLLVESVFAGSSSFCEPLPSNFAVLSQISDIIIDAAASALLQQSAETPVFANGLAYSLTCKIDNLITLISNGTSRLTGINGNYVSAILSGQINQPFQAPLDCIQDELTVLRDKINNAKNVTLSSIISNFIPTNVSTNSLCLELQSTGMVFFEKFLTDILPAVSYLSSAIPQISSISMLDLYENFLNKQISCDKIAIFIASADIFNGNKDEAIAYASGSTSQLSYPLNCLQSINDLCANLINSSYTQVVVAIQNSQLLSSNPSTVCSSLISEFGRVKMAIFEIFDMITNATLYNSLNYPYLIPAYVIDGQLEIQNILYVISQALSVIVNMQWFSIYTILLGFTVPPFDEPLNCISSDLLAVQARVNYLVNDFIPAINRSYVASTVFESLSCSELNVGIFNYSLPIYGYIDDGLERIKNEAQIFESLGLLGSFLGIMENIRVCKLTGLSAIFSILLNGNFENSNNFLMDLSPAVYPYTCVEDAMTTAANYTNQLFSSFVENYANVTTIGP